MLLPHERQTLSRQWQLYINDKEMKISKQASARQHEIVADYLKVLDKHISDIIGGRIERMFEIKDISDILHIHPRHLTNTVTMVTGHHPCFYFEEKIVVAAQQMLIESKMSIASIAILLTYDPSNFTKFFKRYTGKTPKQFREEASGKKTESLTI